VPSPTKLAITSVNGGSSPTAGTPFSVVVQAQDAGGTPQNVTLSTAVTLSVTTGSGTVGGTFSGTIPAGSNSLTISGVTYSKAETPVVFTATRTGGDALADGASASFTVRSRYDAWIAGYPGVGGLTGFSDDPDGDGIGNGLEWVLGGDPSVAGRSILPAVAGSAGGGVTLVFNRSIDTISETTLTVEWDTVFGGAFAHSVAVGAANSGPDANGVTVSVDTPSPGQVTVHIPASNAAGGLLFARLHVSQP